MLSRKEIKYQARSFVELSWRSSITPAEFFESKGIDPVDRPMIRAEIEALCSRRWRHSLYQGLLWLTPYLPQNSNT